MDKFCFSVEKNSILRSPTLQSSFIFDFLLHYIFHNRNLTVTLGVVCPTIKYNSVHKSGGYNYSWSFVVWSHGQSVFPIIARKLKTL